MKNQNKVRDMKGVKPGIGSAGRANANALRRARRQSESKAVVGLAKTGGFTWQQFRDNCDDFLRRRGLPVVNMREALDADTQRRFDNLAAKGI